MKTYHVCLFHLTNKPPPALYIHQKGVQWKQGVVIYMMSYTCLLYKITPIHCTPLPLQPSVMNTNIRCTNKGSGPTQTLDRHIATGIVVGHMLYIYI